MSIPLDDSDSGIIFEPMGAPRDSGLGLGTISGEVIGCACPECGAPMTIRLWLMTADCWSCSISVELTEEQERQLLAHAEAQRQREAAQRAKREQRPRQEAAAATVAPAQQKGTAASAKRRAPAQKAPSRPRREPDSRPGPPARHPKQAPAKPEPKLDKPRSPQPPGTRSPAKQATAAAAPPTQAPPRQVTAPQRLGYDTAAEASNWLKDMPAWLVSLVFHLLLMIILGLWPIDRDPEDPRLVLSLSIGPLHQEGGQILSEKERNPAEYDLPVDDPPETEEEKEALQKAKQDAADLRDLPPSEYEKLPSFAKVREALASDDPYRRLHAARDPRVRVEMVRRHGGTTLTEAAVARALRWLADQQRDDGSWELDGKLRSRGAGTALALMAFLGAGQTHQVGKYGQTVDRGLTWLLEHQKKNGDLRDEVGHAGMYVQGAATIVLCDALHMTADEALRSPAQRAINFICEAQGDRGGWRYRPRQAGDTSVVGWQLMALHSGKAAYLHIPRETLTRAGDFLDMVQSRGGALYAYQRGRSPTPAMTAEGLLCRVYLGWKRDERPAMADGVQFLVEQHLPDENRPNIYYWYYGTQMLFQWGGEPWEQWNRALRDVLVTTQTKAGPHAGSWDGSRMPHGRNIGRLYVTALAACTLEVYYRLAPINRKVDID